MDQNDTNIYKEDLMKLEDVYKELLKLDEQYKKQQRLNEEILQNIRINANKLFKLGKVELFIKDNTPIIHSVRDLEDILFKQYIQKLKE